MAALFSLREVYATIEAVKILSSQQAKLRNQTGQVVVEYVLLLIVAVTLSMIITRLMVRRDPTDPGFVIKAWNQILIEIAQDQPEGR